ncbi:MAG: Adenylate cyclase (EC [uncultured Sulfurovum sp.]|uniref:non-specific serine/threonine protein kinase n=1 Tax=uncultured Sulfurovum sp. TaxID=269237 RepID=A0A6S6UGG4_9BACT|nr:MAG: Adenylate cyclase (EC [uncultured Sulfurovum sp.]
MKINKIKISKSLFVCTLLLSSTSMSADTVLGSGSTESIAAGSSRNMACQNYSIATGATLDTSSGGILAEVNTLSIDGTWNVGTGKVLELASWTNNSTVIGTLTQTGATPNIVFSTTCGTISVTGTADTDSDGFTDFEEGNGAVANGKTLDVDNDGIYNFLDLDSDNDGVSDANEKTAGSDALNAAITPTTVAILEDIAGNVDNTPVTATQLNSVVGVSNALTGVDYSTALANGTYVDSANPTPAEIQAVIDAENASSVIIDTNNAEHLAILGVSKVEVDALLAFYNDTNGTGWTNDSNWTTLSPVSDWNGISVSSGAVTVINLYANNLAGTLSSELGDLSSLGHLAVQTNNLTGSIPVELGNLSSLSYLHLAVNELTGEIPVELGNLTSLSTLALYGNRLTGSIPIELGNLTILSRLFLYDNQLTGSIPLELGNLTALTHLYLYSNQLSGSVPSELGNITALKHLYLYNNQLSGSIPSELGNLSNLESLHFSSNQLSGMIPIELAQLDKLKRFIFSNNKLEGSIPKELGNLTSVIELSLHSNELTGSIPSELGNLTGLTSRLDLANNNLVGSVPSSLADLKVNTGTHSYHGLDIFGNKLTFIDIEPSYTAIIAGAEINGTSQLNGYDISAQQVVDSNRTLASLMSEGNLSITPEYIVNPSGNDNYQWFKDGIAIVGATSRVYTKSDITVSDSGLYTYKVNNTLVTQLELDSHDASEGITVEVIDIRTAVIEDIAGNSDTTPATAVEINAINGVENAITGVDYSTALANGTYVDSANPTPAEIQAVIDAENASSVTIDTNNAEHLAILDVSKVEADALIALYNDTNGTGWTNSTNWATLSPVTDWNGITISAGSVTKIDLDTNNLAGTIPVELGSLLSLRYLYLYNNQLTGEIPKELGNLLNLEYLYLYTNQLTGEIPKELGNLLNLKYLYLYTNQLTGSIPLELGSLSNLTRLYLQSNQLTGSIPVELGSLSNLTRLYLHVNQLTGSIPVELGNLSTLEYLYLHSNELSGSIPTELGNLNSLIRLYLHVNQLTGSIPVELGSLSTLEYLYLYSNELSGNIPIELGNLNSLIRLYLHTNQLTGSIPVELGSLSTLEYLYLYSNELSGNIPTELGNLTSLKYLYLYANELSGNIPTALGNLTSLKYLYLYSNELSGNIPTELGNLSSLTRLYLYANKLTGSIPVELGNLSTLEYLYLYSNELSGNIPTALGNLTTLTRLYLQTNELTGNIPPELENLLNLEYLNLNDNAFTGNIPTELTNLSELISLYLNGNELEGQIPASMVNMTKLTTLSLSNNKFKGDFPSWIGDVVSLENLYVNTNNFTSFPSTLTNLANLKRLQAGDNNLTGEIPTWIGDMPALTDLYWYFNNVTGEIPSFLANLNLKILHLASNQLSGEVPSWLGDEENLTHLILLHNSFTGDLPQSLTNLDNLTTLYIDGNPGLNDGAPAWLEGMSSLTALNTSVYGREIPSYFANMSNLTLLGVHTDAGPMPTWLKDMPNVTYLSIAASEGISPVLKEMEGLKYLYITSRDKSPLSGEIPTWLGDMTYLERLTINNTNISGTIPDELGQLVNLKRLVLTQNNLSGEVPLALRDLKKIDGVHDYQGLDVFGNKFTFSDLEPNYVAIVNEHGISIEDGFDYITKKHVSRSDKYGAKHFSQQAVDTNQSMDLYTESNLTITPELAENPSGNDSYQWYKDGVAILGATDRVFSKENITIADSGLYTYDVNNSIVIGLTLKSHNVSEGISINVADVRTAVIEDIRGNTDGVPATATEINAIEGVSGAREAIDYSEALKNGTYLDSINPSIEEIQMVIDAVNANIDGLEAVKEDILGNINEQVATATEINAIEGVSGAREAIDYSEALKNGTYLDSINPSIEEIQTVIDAVNANIDGLEAVKEDILGNANDQAATATEINAIEGVRGAIEGIDYTTVLENGTYLDLENPTVAEIQTVIDAKNREIYLNSASEDSTSGAILNERVIVDVFANDNLDILDENSIKITGTQKAGERLVVEGEGTWSIEDGKIVFTPEEGFVFDPTAISYSLATNMGERLATAEVEVNYVGLLRNDLELTTDFGTAMTIDVLKNDNGDLNVSTVEIVLPTGFREQHEDALFSKENSGKILFVPNQGTWRVNADGSISYVAQEGVPLVEPTPIKYKVFDNAQNAYLVNGTISIQKSVVADANANADCQEFQNVPTFSSLGLGLIALLGTVFGLFFLRKEK